VSPPFIDVRESIDETPVDWYFWQDENGDGNLIQEIKAAALEWVEDNLPAELQDYVLVRCYDSRLTGTTTIKTAGDYTIQIVLTGDTPYMIFDGSSYTKAAMIMYIHVND
jgi:hypothetical protein